MKRALVTGVTGYVGAALVPKLSAAGFEVRGFARSAARVDAPVDEVVEGDLLEGRGVEQALDGVDVAYYLVHSMEPGDGEFAQRERRSAEGFARVAREAGVRRVVYLGGLVPQEDAGDRRAVRGTRQALSRHLGSRLAVEEVLLDGFEEPFCFRASIVIGARSRSFRFLVRLVERLPVLALPAWRENRTQPIDGRDMTEVLVRAATAEPSLCGSWDVVGPETLTYGRLIGRIADVMMVGRPRLGIGLTMTPIAAPIAAAIAGEDPELIQPLMESLEDDLLARPGRDASKPFGVRLHGFDAAVERALREWEAVEEVGAR